MKRLALLVAVGFLAVGCATPQEPVKAADVVVVVPAEPGVKVVVVAAKAPTAKATTQGTGDLKADYPATVKAGEKFDFAPHSVKCATGKGCGVFKKDQEVWVDKSKKVTKLYWGCPCVCLHTNIKFSKPGKHTVDVKLPDGSWASFPVTVTK